MKFINTSAILFAGNISIAVTSLVLGVFTARYLGPESRGLYYLIMQIISIGSIILAVGLGPSYQYYLSKETFKKSEILTHQLFQLLFIALLLSLFAIFFRSTFIGYNKLSLSLNYTGIISISIFLSIVFIYANSILMTYERGVYSLTIMNVVSSFVNTMLFVVCALAFSVDIDIALFAYFIGLLFRILPSLFIVHRYASVQSSINWLNMSTELYKYGAASFVFNIAVVFVLRIDTFIVNSLVGLEDLGKLAVAVTFAEMVLILPGSIGSALFSHFPTLNTTDQIELLKKTCRSVVAITAVICLVLAALSPIIITMLVGEMYMESILLLRILLLGLVALSSAYVFANYFAGAGRPLVAASVFGLGLVVKVSLIYLLVPIFGIYGAAIASSVGYISIAFTFYVLLFYTHNVKAASLFILTREDVLAITLRAKSIIR